MRRDSEAWMIAYREHYRRSNQGVGCKRMDECPVCAKLASDLHGEAKPQGQVVSVNTYDRA